ncbi:MAG: adenosylmethionine--8-amino-7-oxononanoate transaminase [Candidatus Omnitrophica bacterium]|nr:adenosylmethionine--8-amino-7-oxononanoate transaminase [Candidatus Omnitrophota bacterium]
MDKKKKQDDYINPLDFFDLDDVKESKETIKKAPQRQSSQRPKGAVSKEKEKIVQQRKPQQPKQSQPANQRQQARQPQQSKVPQPSKQAQPVKKSAQSFKQKPLVQPAQKKQVTRKFKQKRGLFISGTDTDVGKTIVTAVLGTLLQDKGVDVGVMKPIQCGGSDTKRLQKFLQVRDSFREMNPYYTKEALSPNVAFKRQKCTIYISRILQNFERLKSQHDLLLVEGAGGLMVPIKDDYLMSDLVKDMDLEMIIVARLGLGTINHTLLTINHAQQKGIPVKGIIFSETEQKEHGVAEKTNSEVVEKISGVPVLGVVPFLPKISQQEVLHTCTQLDLKPLMAEPVKKKPRQEVAWDKKYLWHPFTQMQDWLKEEPVIIDEAAGCYLKDINGKKYLDGVSSLWVNVHGHRHKTIDAAIKKQIDKLGHSTLLGLSNTPAVTLAKKLVEITPGGLDKVFYSDNGSTSVEIAVKMAYQYWQNAGKKEKTQIAHLSNSYHGDTLGSVSIGGIDLFHKVYKKLIFQTMKIDFPDFYRAPRGKKYPQYTQQCLNQMERQLRSNKNKIAALVVEPIVQGAAGMIVWPQGVLARVKEMCAKYKIFLIADEVATGFGRTGKMFACEHEKVVPDFLCVAKGVTGGYLPLAATLTTKEVFDGFLFNYDEQKMFFHGHTYTGNPLCCAAALANLEVFEKEQTLRNLQPKIKFLQKQLEAFSDLGHVGDVRQKGFMVGIELVKNKKTAQPYPWKDQTGVRVCRAARQKGVVLRPLGDVIVLMPPLSISENELKKLLDVSHAAIQEITG